jgi:hypothetical protein
MVMVLIHTQDFIEVMKLGMAVELATETLYWEPLALEV